MTLKEIPISAFANNFPYSVRYGRNTALEKSVKQQGILQPVFVHKEKNTYIIVSGKGRFQAARRYGFSKIPAMIIPRTSQEKLFQTSISHDLQTAIPYSPVEKAAVFQKLKSFALPREDMQRIFHDLKIPFHHRSQLVLSRISSSYAKVKKWIHEKNIPFSLLDFLLEFSPMDMHLLTMQIFLPFNPSASEAASIAGNIHDICLQNKRSLHSVLQQTAQETNPEKNRKENCRKILIMLHAMRYPHYSRLLQKFKTLQKELCMPPFSQLSLSLSAFQKSLCFQAALSQEKEIDKLFEWFSNKEKKKLLLSFLKEGEEEFSHEGHEKHEVKKEKKM